MNILFICNGNVARSQEAELFFNTLKNDGVSIAKSGGINVKIGKPIDPLVIKVMNEIGYDMSKAVRKFASQDIVNQADLLISFKPKDELPDYLKNNANIRYCNVPDPQAQPIEFHRQVRNQIKAIVASLIEEFSL